MRMGVKAIALSWEKTEDFGISAEDYAWQVARGGGVFEYSVGFHEPFGFWAYSDHSDESLGYDLAALEDAQAAAQEHFNTVVEALLGRTENKTA
jgi:hypothetical protein